MMYSFSRFACILICACAWHAGAVASEIEPWGSDDEGSGKHRLSADEFTPSKWGCQETDTFHAHLSTPESVRARNVGDSFDVLLDLAIPSNDLDFAHVRSPKNHPATQPGCAEDPFVTASVSVNLRDQSGYTAVLTTSSPAAYQGRLDQAMELRRKDDDCRRIGDFLRCQGIHDNGMFGTFPASFYIYSPEYGRQKDEDFFYTQCATSWDDCIVTMPYYEDAWLLMRHPEDVDDYAQLKATYQALRLQIDSYRQSAPADSPIE